MSDYTDREIPVLDDIISSPLKTNELLADAKIHDEPEIQTNVQLDIPLETQDEPVLISDIPAQDELTDTQHNLINTEQAGSEHSDARIEPALHHTDITETFKHEIDAAADNTDDFTFKTTDNALNDSLNETIENNQNSEQKTPDEDYDDPDILPSGERLYRYIPDAQVAVEPQVDTQNNAEPAHADALAVDTLKDDALEIDTLETEISGATPPEQPAPENEQTDPSYRQDQDTAIADTSNEQNGSEQNASDDDNFISDDSTFKTRTEITATEAEDDRATDNRASDDRAGDDKTWDDSDNKDEDEVDSDDDTTPATQQADITEHESALIDYQSDVDPYSMDEIATAEDDAAENTHSANNIRDDAPQWHDIQQEISGIQAETNATATDSLILSTLNNIDTEALTEQVLQNVLPNIEQQLRLHIKASIQEALKLSVKQSPLNNEESPPDA